MSVNKLEITERELGGGVVIDLAGELTVRGTTDHLLDKVRARIESGCRLLVVNLSQCGRVDSAGLGELVTCLVTATRHDAVFRLACVPQPIRGLLKMTNMHKAFEVFETEEEALK